VMISLPCHSVPTCWRLERRSGLQLQSCPGQAG
jgi:hypothetical protein